jgi:hypothetical protein
VALGVAADDPLPSTSTRVDTAGVAAAVAASARMRFASSMT